MLSIEECKKTLNKDGIVYTDEEVKEIREFLYILADIEYSIYQYRKEKEYLKSEEAKIVQLTLNTQTKDEKSDSIHPGEHRRAG